MLLPCDFRFVWGHIQCWRMLVPSGSNPNRVYLVTLPILVSSFCSFTTFCGLLRYIKVSIYVQAPIIYIVGFFFTS